MLINARTRELPTRPALIATTTVAFTLFIAAFCKIASVNMTPFRAESGWFIARAWAAGERLDFIKAFLLKAYNGHFTPFFFGSEFLQARMYGANEQLWFWRQMLVLGILASALFLLCRAVCLFTNLSRSSASLVSATFPLLFILQPTVLELAAWPFMAAQLLCLACAALSMSYTLNLIRTSALRDATLALMWAYAAMHLSGIGFAVSITVLLSASAIVWAQRLPRRFLLPIAAFAAVTLVHAAFMTTTDTPPSGAPQPLGTNIERLGALYMGSIQSGARSLWANGRFPWPNPAAYSVDAVYGIGLMSCVSVVFGLLLWHAKALGRADLLVCATLLALPALALPMYCGMIVIRLHTVDDPNAIAPFLFGTRYLIFPAFFLFVSMLLALPTLARILGRALIIPLALLAGSAGIATFVFFSSVATLWPYMAINAGDEWQNIVSQARTELVTEGHVMDRPMAALDPELQRNLSEYKALLETDLPCSNCVQFSPNKPDK